MRVDIERMNVTRACTILETTIDNSFVPIEAGRVLIDLPWDTVLLTLSWSGADSVPLEVLQIKPVHLVLSVVTALHSATN